MNTSPYIGKHCHYRVGNGMDHVCGGKDDPDERDGSWAFTIPRLRQGDMGTGVLDICRGIELLQV